jgi:hypothetical protein
MMVLESVAFDWVFRVTSSNLMKELEELARSFYLMKMQHGTILEAEKTLNPLVLYLQNCGQ